MHALFLNSLVLQSVKYSKEVSKRATRSFQKSLLSFVFLAIILWHKLLGREKVVSTRSLLAAMAIHSLQSYGDVPCNISHTSDIWKQCGNRGS